MLHLLLGPSGSGKSYTLRELLRQRADAGQRSILIVPEQFTSSTEGMLYRTLGDSRSMFVESYSFTSLAETLLRRYGGAAVPTLTEAGRAMLVRRAMDSLLDKVVYYSRQRRSAAFCEKAAQTIEELKSAGVTPEQLADFARKPGADREKLSELSLIFAAYEALLQQTAMDPGDRVQRAAQTLDAAWFAGRAVFIDEFDTFNAPKRAMLAAMLPVTDVTVSLCCDSDAPDDGMGTFSGGRRVASLLKRMARDAGVDTHTTLLTEDRRHTGTLAELNLLLADPAYTPERTVDPAAPDIVQYAAASRQDEAKAAAAAIRARARAGTPYRKMAVICRSADSYRSAVRYEFRLQNIPLFCDEPTTPEHTAPARAVHAALEILRSGVNSRTMVRLLKTGLTSLPEDAQCALENYTYTWPLKAEEWRGPFTRSAAGYSDRATDEDVRTLALAEQAREFLVSRAQKFIAKARNKPAAETTRQIYLFLQSLGAEETLNALAADLRRRGELPAAEEALREWNTVMELLNQLAGMMGEESLSPADYAELFTLLLRTTDMGHIPQSLDSVIFTTAGRMRLPEVDAVFVLGLAEGEFPQTPGDIGLLTHADRDLMMNHGADLPDCFENRVLREGICFYKALTAPAQFLWLSWPGGQELPPSAAVTPVLELLAVPPARLTAEELGGTPAAALDLLGSLWQNADDPRRAAVLAALEQQSNVSLAALHRAAAAGFAGATVEDTAALQALLGPKLRVSPTKFERYSDCPFGYFLQYILKASPRQKAELAPNISGTLTHWVLEQALSRQGGAFTALSDEDLKALVDSLVKEYADASLPGQSQRMEYLLQRISRNLVSLLAFIRRDFRQSGFRPAAYELRIDDDGVPPVELPDGLGHTVRIVGTVDRVDTMTLQNKTYLRVVDYKTGTKKFDLREVYCGKDCQMLLYLFTLERNGGALFENPAAAGVEYLWADPAQETDRRPEEGQAAPQDYPLEGLLLDEESVYRAMDTKGTGAFVPLTFKNGKLHFTAKKRLADPAKLGRIRDHLDGLLVAMAQNLYTGQVQAQPLCSGNRRPCQYCDYRAVCGHRDGENERCIELSEDPFEE